MANSTIKDVLAFLRSIQGHSVGYAPNRVYRGILHDVEETDALVHRVEALVKKQDVMAAIAAFRRECGKGYGPAWNGIIFQKGQACLVPVPGAEYSGERRVHVFPDGERLRIASIRSEKDYWKFHGHRYTFVAPVDVSGGAKVDGMVKTLLGFEPPIPSIFYTEEQDRWL